MSVTSEQSNEAMARFLVSRYERVIGEPILASETWLTGDMFEWIEMHDSDFFWLDYYLQSICYKVPSPYIKIS